MKRALSFILTICLIITTFGYCFTGTVSAAISGKDLTEEELAAKNYTLPKDHVVSNVYATYDDGADNGGGVLSTDEGTYYDKQSMKLTTTTYSEGVATKMMLDGVGFMFWYKSDTAHVMRIRDSKNGLIAEANLPICTEGKWITYYYFGKCINFTFKTDMSSDIRKNINPEETYNLQFYAWGTKKDLYIDEVYTFTPKITPADSYTAEEDETAYKFSVAKVSENKNAICDYYDDGSADFYSTSGETTSSTPVNIFYKPDIEQFKKAVAIANEDGGSGYLQMQCDNISCQNSKGNDAYATIYVGFVGLERSIKKYSYGTGTSDVFLLDVSGLTDEDIDLLTKIEVKITGSSIKNVKFKLSPFTVYHFDEDELILQAEDLNPTHTGTAIEPSTIYDNNREYIYYGSNNTSKYLSFELPNLEVGEYEVSVAVAAKTTNSKFNIAINNLRQLCDVIITDATYANQWHDIVVDIGTLKITKDYEDGASILKFLPIHQQPATINVDYFIFKKTDTVVQTEPSSNFVIKDYPVPEDYEIKTKLDTFDTFICGSDLRYYHNNQLAGYVGDGTAYNLNSRGTINMASADANHVWSSTTTKVLDGYALRYWVKCEKGYTMRFSGKYNGENRRIDKYYPACPEGDWVTIFYNEIVEDGDFTWITNIVQIPGGGSTSIYIDEMHTIQQEIGDISYEVDNTSSSAYVSGYNLRIEDIEVKDVYNNFPVTKIKANALSSTLTLTKVKLPNSVTTIEQKAFYNDLNLKTVDFGTGVRTIGDYAFENCKDLVDVTLPEGITSVSDSAFTGCTSLYININSEYSKDYAQRNSIDYIDVTDDGLVYYCDYDASGNTVRIIGYTGSKTTINVPSTIDDFSVVKIASDAFSENEVIENLTLPDSVVTIENNAFKNCTTIKSIVANGVTTIGESAFYGCSNLETATLSNAVTTIGATAFYSCSALKELYFSDNLTSIGSNAFYNCTFVADLSDDAYTERSSYSYKFVNTNGFKNYPPTSSEFKYYIINEIATIYKYTGSSAAITIPDTIDEYQVQNIEKETFRNNTTLTSVNFASSPVRVIDEYAFDGCQNLSSVLFNDNLRNINDYAFTNCKSLKSVQLNDIVIIAPNAFDATTTVSKLQTNFVRSALDYVDGMTVGWNLGNTLDAHSKKNSYGALTVSQHEHLWTKSDIIQQDTFDLVSSCFNTIRIPITWNVFIDPNNDYAIDKAFMDRIEEVVNMCYTAGFEYIIINTHHDSDYYFNVHTSNPNYNKINYIVDKVWAQIADRFKNYDEKLIFESFNEIRGQDVEATSGNGDWTGNQTYYNLLNTMNQTFYNTVRKSGGNNDRRYLLIQSYAGMRDGQLGAMWLPTIEEDNHIIASMHWYPGSTTYEGHYTAIINRCVNTFLKKGIPLVIGEIGLERWYTDEVKENWVDTVVPWFNEAGLKLIIWHDHGDYSTIGFDENGSPFWLWPLYCEALRDNTLKEDVYVPPETTIPPETTTSTTAISTVTTALPASTNATTAQITTALQSSVVPITTVATTAQITTALQSSAITSTITTQPPISTVNYGDCNDDGKITIADVLILRKYLAKWKVEPNLLNTDINADNKINMTDVLILRKYLAKWNVVLGPTK